MNNNKEREARVRSYQNRKCIKCGETISIPDDGSPYQTLCKEPNPNLRRTTHEFEDLITFVTIFPKSEIMIFDSEGNRVEVNES